MATIDDLLINVEAKTEKAEGAISRLTQKFDAISRAVEMTEKRLAKLNKPVQVMTANDVFAKPIRNAMRAMDDYGKSMTKQENYARESISSIEQFEKKLDKVHKATRRWNMQLLGLGLSMLFTGMALKRFADNTIKSLTNAFMTVADESNATVKEIMSVQAAFMFLKFAIMETLGKTDLFLGFINFLVTAANWLSRFVQEHPKLVELLGVFLIIGTVLGGIAMVIGQISLLAVGIGIGLGPLIGILVAISAALTGIFFIFSSNAPTWEKVIAGISAAFLGLVGVMYALGYRLAALGGIVTIVAAAILLLFTIWNSNMSPVAKILSTIVVVMGAILGIAKILGVALSAPFIVVAAVIAIVIAALILLSQKVGGLGNAFLAIGVFILRILAAIGDAVLWILAPVRWLIEAANAAANYLGRKDIIDVSKIPESGDLGKKVDAMRDNLLRKGEEARREAGLNELGGKQDTTNNLLSQILGKIESNSSLTSSTEK